MGKPSESQEFIERQLLRKIKVLFEEVTRKDERDTGAGYDEPVSFATFVESFDVNDKLTKKFFEFLLREVRRRRNRRRQQITHQSRALGSPPWTQIQRVIASRRQNSQSALENLDFGREMSLRRSGGPPLFSIRAGPSWAQSMAAAAAAASELGAASWSSTSSDSASSSNDASANVGGEASSSSPSAVTMSTASTSNNSGGQVEGASRTRGILRIGRGRGTARGAQNVSHDVELGFMGLSQPHTELLAASLGALDAAIEAMPLRPRDDDDPQEAGPTMGIDGP